MDKINTLCSLVSQTHLLIEQMDLETIFDNQVNEITNITNENSQLKIQLTELKFKYDKDMELIINELKCKQEELSNLTKVSYIQSLNKQLMEKTNYCQILESQLDKFKKEQIQNGQPNPVIAKLAKKAADVQAELELQKEENEKAKLLVGKKYKKQTIIEQDSIETINEIDELVPDVKPKKSKKYKKQEAIDIEIKQPEIVEQEQDQEAILKSSKKQKNQMVDDDEEPIQEDTSIKKNKKSNKQTISEETKKVVDKDLEFNPENFEDINGFELLQYKLNYYLRDLETNELYDINSNKPGIIIGLINGKGKVKLH